MHQRKSKKILIYFFLLYGFFEVMRLIRIGIPSNPNLSLILFTIYLFATLGTLEFLLWYILNVGGLILF